MADYSQQPCQGRGTGGPSPYQREDRTITSEPRGYPGFPGKIGRTREELEPHWNLPVRPPRGIAEHRDRLDGRYGMGGCRLLRLGDRHTQHRCAGRPRDPFHPLYDASDLLAGARRLTDRQKCAFGGDRVAGQQQSGLPGLFRRHSARRADDRRNLARGRIRDDRGRQVAQFDRWRLAQPDLADLSRLRPFLWVSRRRNQLFLSRRASSTTTS